MRCLLNRAVRACVDELRQRESWYLYMYLYYVSPEMLSTQPRDTCALGGPTAAARCALVAREGASDIVAP